MPPCPCTSISAVEHELASRTHTHTHRQTHTGTDTHYTHTDTHTANSPVQSVVLPPVRLLQNWQTHRDSAGTHRSGERHEGLRLHLEQRWVLPHTRTHTHTHTHARTHTHTHTRTHTHTHAHTHTNANQQTNTSKHAPSPCLRVSAAVCSHMPHRSLLRPHLLRCALSLLQRVSGSAPSPRENRPSACLWQASPSRTAYVLGTQRKARQAGRVCVCFIACVIDRHISTDTGHRALGTDANCALPGGVLVQTAAGRCVGNRSEAPV